MKRFFWMCFLLLVWFLCLRSPERAVAQTPSACESFVKTGDAAAEAWRNGDRKDTALFSKAKSDYFRATDVAPECLLAWEKLYDLGKEGRHLETYCLGGMQKIKLTVKNGYSEANRKFIVDFCEVKKALPYGTFSKMETELQARKAEMPLPPPSPPPFLNAPPKNSAGLLSTMMPPLTATGPPKPKEAPPQIVRPKGMEGTPPPSLAQPKTIPNAKETVASEKKERFPEKEATPPVPAPKTSSEVSEKFSVKKSGEEKPSKEQGLPVNTLDVPMVDLTPLPSEQPREETQTRSETVSVPSAPPQGKKNCLSSPFQGDWVTSKDDADLNLLNQPSATRASPVAKWPAGNGAKFLQRDGVWALVEFRGKKGWVLWGSLCRFDFSGKNSPLEAVANAVSKPPSEEKLSPPSVASARVAEKKKVKTETPEQSPPLPPVESQPQKEKASPPPPPEEILAAKAVPTQTETEHFSKERTTPEKVGMISGQRNGEEKTITKRPVTEEEFRAFARSGRLGKPRFFRQKDGSVRIVYPLKQEGEKK